MRRLFRRRVEPQPPPGATPDEAATQPITAIREEDTAIREEEVVTRPVRRPPRIWPWLLALLLLVLAGIAAAYLLTRDDDDDAAEPTSVTVPDVVGDDVGDAMRELATNGLTGQVVRIASNRPREEVIRQRPPAGAAIERGERVALVVSEGPPRARVPDVVGLPLSDAFRRIEAAQLRPQARRVFSSQPRGRVVRQRPAAGTELEREQVVSLTVSRGRERVAAPALVGLREAQAGTRLRSAGLKANAVRVASSEPAGTVVAQNPTAGERVPRGSAVRINVSSGPSATTTTTTTTPTGTTTTRTTTTTTTTTPTGTASSAATVPDVIGLDEPTARSRLRQAGFATRTVTRDTPDPAEDGIVLDQRPVAGMPARAGTQVTITVGVLTP